MRKLFGIIAIAAVAVAAGWNFNQSKNEANLSNLALMNIQALASGESGGIDCASNYKGAYCGYFTDTSGNRTNVYYKK